MPDDDAVLHETLKRCSPATYYAACKFRDTGDCADLRTVIVGVVERFVDREARPKLRAPSDALRLREDLGIDSLTMMEIIMIAEEVLRISVANDELTHLKTLGDVQRFVESKLTSPSRPLVPKPATATNEWDLRSVGEQIRQLDSNRGSIG
jgi:3-hydroxyacyl-[acyl-carrier-protein] dehydratase